MSCPKKPEGMSGDRYRSLIRENYISRRAQAYIERNSMSFIRELIKRWRACRDYDWRWVPPPNIRCSRGGKEYW